MRLPVALAVPEVVGQIRTVKSSRQDRRNVVIFTYHLENQSTKKKLLAPAGTQLQAEGMGRRTPGPLAQL